MHLDLTPDAIECVGRHSFQPVTTSLCHSTLFFDPDHGQVTLGQKPQQPFVPARAVTKTVERLSLITNCIQQYVR